MDLTKMARSLPAAALLAFCVLVAGVALTACGSDDSDSSGTSAPGNGIDRAFVADMIPHHEAAVQMAKIAGKRATSDFVKGLADDIIRTQNEEITSMRGIAAKLDAAGVKPVDLGLSQDMMGMDHDTAMLDTANPFDRAFIDMMIPHHQGAIRMARIELAKGSSAEAKKLASQIIAAQAREIDAMNMHRTEAFGKASPAGGVPPENEKVSKGHGMTTMDHG